ncbi:MAG: glycosyltransferase [Chitinophagales bacterium]|nr:glycosyltransferase [Chitinophagales bacterium]MDW8393615.1 glycosyltransferase [Chitinophagales bacterium]
MMLSLLLGILLVLYVAIMLVCILGWTSLKEGCPGKATVPMRVTVVVVARNEEQAIGALLQDLLEQDYPAEWFDVLVVDDHSEDGTATVVERLADSRVRLMRLSDRLGHAPFHGSHKKKGVTLAVQESPSDWIALTDADCRVAPGWLRTMMACQQFHQAVLVCGPVRYRHGPSLLQRLLALDQGGLSAVGTATLALGIPTVCNGANLLFSRSAFLQTDPYADNLHRSSGDDMFLLHSFYRQYAHRVTACKSPSALVTTSVPDSWREALNQRRRWASKMNAFRQWPLRLMFWGVGWFHVVLLASAIGLLFSAMHLGLFLLALLTKFVLDFIFLYQIMRFVGQEHLMRLFLFAELFHSALLLWTGLTARQPTSWKGRTVT